MSRGYCPGGYCPGDVVRGDIVWGILSGGYCLGGYCPGGYCPRTDIPSSAIIPLSAYKGVVVFQVDWGMLLISAAGGVMDGDFAQVVLSSEVELEQV